MMVDDLARPRIRRREASSPISDPLVSDPLIIDSLITDPLITVSMIAAIRSPSHRHRLLASPWVDYRQYDRPARSSSDARHQHLTGLATTRRNSDSPSCDRTNVTSHRAPGKVRAHEVSEISFKGHQKQEEMSDQKQEQHSESNFLTQFPRGQLKWFFSILAITAAFTVWLLTKDAKGSEIASILSLATTIVSTALTFLMFLYQNTSKGNRKGIPPGNPRRTSRLLVPLAAIVLGAGVPIYYWTEIHKPNSRVTDQMSVFNGKAMHDGGQATITIPGRPPQHDHLAIVLTLTNHADVGDCVRPAKLDITPIIDSTPVIDGRPEQLTSVRPGQEVRLDLSDVTRQAAVLVTLDTPDPSCRVELRVSQAVLYN
ncbi:MAG: hypothetical protein ACT4NY_03285 [Pseudonocardiales bacterium]